MKQALHNVARRDFAVVTAARTLSLLGDMLLLTVIALRIAASDQPWRLTVVYIAFAIPLVALAPWAGRIVDELDSRTVLVCSGLLQAGAAGGIALAGNFPALVAAIIVLQAGQAVSAPAWSALVPRVVGREAVGRATGHLAAAGAIAGMAGAAMGGLLYQPLGFGGVVTINGGGFLLIAAAGLLVRTRRGRRFDRRHTGSSAGRRDVADAVSSGPMGVQTALPADPILLPGEDPTPLPAGAPLTEQVGTPAPTTPSSTVGGWAFCRRDAVLSVLLPALCALVIGGEALNVAEVFLIRGVLGASPTLYGVCGAAFLVGSVVGPLLAGRVADDRRRIWWSAVTAALSGALVVGMAVSPSAWIVAVLLAGAGVLMGAFNALIVAVILLRPPEQIRGRVMATVNGTMRTCTIVALVLGGVMVQFAGARVAFAVVGLSVAGAAVLLRRVVGSIPRSIPCSGSSGREPEPGHALAPDLDRARQT